MKNNVAFVYMKDTGLIIGIGTSPYADKELTLNDVGLAIEECHTRKIVEGNDGNIYYKIDNKKVQKVNKKSNNKILYIEDYK